MTYAVDSLRGAFIHFHQFDHRLGPVALVRHGAVLRLACAASAKRETPVAGAARDVVTFAGVFGLLGAVYLLPPEQRTSGPGSRGGNVAGLSAAALLLVTGDPALPGIDVELLRAVAARLGVTLTIVSNSAIGQDFNPRAWRITRAQCDIIGGGMAGSDTTRSFLDTTPSYARTGWAWLATRPMPPLQGVRLGILAAASGLDRIALAAWARRRRPGRRRAGRGGIASGVAGRAFRCRCHRASSGAGSGGEKRPASGMDAGHAHPLSARLRAVERRPDPEASDRRRDGAAAAGWRHGPDRGALRLILRGSRRPVATGTARDTGPRSRCR